MSKRTGAGPQSYSALGFCPTGARSSGRGRLRVPSQSRADPDRPPTRTALPPRQTGGVVSEQGVPQMKVLMWIIGIIFLIGLLVVLGLGAAIF